MIPGIFFPHRVIIGITAGGIVIVVSPIAAAEGPYWGALVVVESVGSRESVCEVVSACVREWDRKTERDIVHVCACARASMKVCV